MEKMGRGDLQTVEKVQIEIEDVENKLGQLQKVDKPNRVQFK